MSPRKPVATKTVGPGSGVSVNVVDHCAFVKAEAEAGAFNAAAAPTVWPVVTLKTVPGGITPGGRMLPVLNGMVDRLCPKTLVPDVWVTVPDGSTMTCWLAAAEAFPMDVRKNWFRLAWAK